ncbi:YitT family protein [Cytobacillus sp. FJAT-54145]|uniref:YitT family protein n=1 Tax=Cytobacillus spartinae TaxID=3299023 RepID=A0ABW6KB53_9BACI
MRLIYKILFFIVGLLILTNGVALTIKADLGAGSWDALNVGLSNTIGFTVGTWVIIVGLILIFVNGYLLKKRPDFLAIITITLVGFLIDFWLLIVYRNLEAEVFGYQLVLLLVGMLMIGIGISIYLQPKFPLIPIDNLMLAIQFRLKVNLMVAKTIGEAIALTLAFIVKGPIGLGTIIVTFLIGPIIQFFFPYFEKLLNKLLEKQG